MCEDKLKNVFLFYAYIYSYKYIYDMHIIMHPPLLLGVNAHATTEKKFFTGGEHADALKGKSVSICSKV